MAGTYPKTVGEGEKKKKPKPKEKKTKNPKTKPQNWVNHVIEGFGMGFV